MATAPAVHSEVQDELYGAALAMPIEQYLRTVFRPDRDYVNGFAEERSVGEYEHGKVQLMLLRLLGAKELDWQIDVVPECRLQVRPDRFRVLDVMVLRAGDTVDRYPRIAPLICIEILSPEDTWARLRQVLDDYLAMGAENVWAFDPQAREAFRYDAEGFRKMTELTGGGTEIRLNVAEVFSVLKQNEKA